MARVKRTWKETENERACTGDRERERTREGEIKGALSCSVDWQLNNGRAVHTGPLCRGGDARSSQTAFTPHRRKKKKRRGGEHQRKNEEERKYTRKLFARINISLQSVDLLSAKCQAALSFFCLPLPSPIYFRLEQKARSALLFLLPLIRRAGRRTLSAEPHEGKSNSAHKSGVG